MQMSAPSSGAKYTRPIVCAIAGPLGVRPHAASETAIRKASAPFRVTGMFMGAILHPRFTCVVTWGRPSGLLARTDLQG